MEGNIGEIRLFAGVFTPNNWVRCEGQLLPVSENSGLFEVIGSIYGGDGTKTFAVPDLRGRVAVGTGENPKVGLDLQTGRTIGALETTLTLAQIPTSTTGTMGTPALVVSEKTNKPQVPTPVSLMQPSMGLNYIICYDGTFPQRN